jgi:ferrous iron transport protein B
LNSKLKVALIGNPNTGKSTVFNALTGLNQKIGNFPGVTVDKKTGLASLSTEQTAIIIDLPGTYSLYPRSKDETIAIEILSSPHNINYPDIVVVVADASNLKRNLLLFTQIIDLKIPVVLALNMIDTAKDAGIEIDVKGLEAKLGIPVVPMNAREMKGITELKESIFKQSQERKISEPTIDVKKIAPGIIDEIKEKLSIDNDYVAFELAHHYKELKFLSKDQKHFIEELGKKYDFNPQKIQATETIARYNFINDLLYDCVHKKQLPQAETYSNRIDKILTHRVFGFLIFFFILFLVFQSIFSWSEYPMELIERGFSALSAYLHDHLPAGILTDLLTNGILPGLSGVFVFVPQIAILFLFIAILEDTGYMARVTFMMDRAMKKVGLNGKSVVPLISGIACAVPAIMSARTIENWKDRIITIMVTPLMSCSARLPVYTLLISLIVPDTYLWGFLNLQGLALMGMYLLGFFAAILASAVMKFIIKTKQRSYFIMELPVYRMPRWSNIGIEIYNKSKTFVLEAGKVILAVSIILWVLASYGPSDKISEVEKKYSSTEFKQSLSAEELNMKISSEKLEASYAGMLGKVIEPVIKPLGFDWKIGIALITSFAAREVFVGTMATIYSVQGDDKHLDTVREKMRDAKNPDTGEPVFTVPVAFSLMIFFAFAMQCMSTFAVVYRETNSFKWPLIQLLYMTGMAYLASLLAYQLLK